MVYFLPEASKSPESGLATAELFKQHSLDALRESLGQGVYPGYPQVQDRLWVDEQTYLREPITLPHGNWETSDGMTPTIPERLALNNLPLRYDAYGRPLHPWFDEMLANPHIGVVTGKGFYWQWGPNYTADPIVIRRDLGEPHVLLIQRGDTGHLALPGGFINKGEPALQAAMREAAEESGVLLHQLAHSAKPIYTGPLADLRVTANAWPETTAICFDLALNTKSDQKMLAEMMSKNHQQPLLHTLGRVAFKKRLARLPWKGGDDAVNALWLPASQLNNRLFGSHRLLIELGLNS